MIVRLKIEEPKIIFEPTFRELRDIILRCFSEIIASGEGISRVRKLFPLMIFMGLFLSHSCSRLPYILMLSFKISISLNATYPFNCCFSRWNVNFFQTCEVNDFYYAQLELMKVLLQTMWIKPWIYLD